MDESIEEARARRRAIAKAQARLDEIADERRRTALVYYNRSRFSVRNLAKAPFRVARAVWELKQ